MPLRRIKIAIVKTPASSCKTKLLIASIDHHVNPQGPEKIADRQGNFFSLVNGNR
jgi:hypothetical protein